MKILKSCRDHRTLYDTAQPDYWQSVDLPVPPLKNALQYHIEGRIHPFLSQYYPPDHSIFDQFADAYFFKHDTL